MTSPTVSLESREAVFSAMILQCYMCMAASSELCSLLHTPCHLLETQPQLAQNFHVTFSRHPIQKKNSMQNACRKSHTLNFDQCTFSSVCSMISHVFIEEYLARQQFQVFTPWNVIPINCTFFEHAHQIIFSQQTVARKSQGQCVFLGLLCKIKPVSENSNTASPNS